MEMEIDGRKVNVRSCYIQYDVIDGKEWYFVIVMCRNSYFRLDPEIVSATQDPKEALQCKLDIELHLRLWKAGKVV